MAKLKKTHELMSIEKMSITVLIDDVVQPDQKIELSQSKDVFFLSINAQEKPIYRAEYVDILKKLTKDHASGQYRLSFKTLKEAHDFYQNYFVDRDTDKLLAIGVLLYGDVWKSAIAIALGVDARRVTHWLQCTRPIPNNVWDQLLQVCTQRQQEISESIKIVKSKI